MRRLSGWALMLASCAARPAAAPPVPQRTALPTTPAPPFRLRACTEAPVRLEGAPGATQSRGCVVTFRQRLTDPATIAVHGANEVDRRYLVYAPAVSQGRALPVVLVFPGYSSSAETIAFYTTHTRFEALADREGFVVVYGNGLPTPPSAREHVTVPRGGFLSGCLSPHQGEGIDVQYVRAIVDQLAAELPIDRTRIYATGFSAGGGMSLQLALEAPDLVAAVAPVAPLPFVPDGGWLLNCHPRPGYQQVSIAMVAATDDPFITYAGGGSREYPQARYPGMERARDVWAAALGLTGPPQVDAIPDVVEGDSYQPDTGRTTSTIERQRFGPGADGRELWYYKATGMGHAWPDPTPSWSGLWKRFGKNNQDLDFAAEAWTFFQRHVKGPSGTAAAHSDSGGARAGSGELARSAVHGADTRLKQPP